jgi:hypothetical protein
MFAHGGSFRVTVLFIYSSQFSIFPVKTRLPILNRKHWYFLFSNTIIGVQTTNRAHLTYTIEYVLTCACLIKPAHSQHWCIHHHTMFPCISWQCFLPKLSCFLQLYISFHFWRLSYKLNHTVIPLSYRVYFTQNSFELQPYCLAMFLRVNFHEFEQIDKIGVQQQGAQHFHHIKVT